jgi:hypothetical protein
LDHETLDHTVEGAAFVVERLAILAFAFLAGTEGAEVLGCLGDDVVVEFEEDFACFFAADGDLSCISVKLFGQEVNEP